MVTQEQIKRNIAETLRNMEISQTELSKQIGVGPSTIAHYVKGDICPSLEAFVNICNVLKLEREEICEILCIK